MYWGFKKKIIFRFKTKLKIVDDSKSITIALEPNIYIYNILNGIFENVKISEINLFYSKIDCKKMRNFIECDF